MMLNKTIGYILLALGLVLIGWTVWQSVNIFTAKAEAPLVFKTPVLEQSSANSVKTLEQQIQAQMEQTIQKQLGQILSPSAITKVLNLTSWSLLAFILITAGGAMSGIGVKLIKS